MRIPFKGQLCYLTFYFLRDLLCLFLLFTMVVKLYADLLSQPARAIALFLKKTNIPHELKVVSIAKGENRAPEYVKNFHRFGKVPAIDDDGVRLIESVAILRYLARKYDVPDHWYPKDLQKQAKVDEFLEWHHIGERVPLAMYFRTVFLTPLFTGKKADEKEIEMWRKRMEEALDLLENVWLDKTPFLTGEKISIADLIGISEIEQPRMVNYDVTVGRPKIAAWMKRVKDEVQPHYNEVFKVLEKVAAGYKAKL